MIHQKLGILLVTASFVGMTAFGAETVETKTTTTTPTEQAAATADAMTPEGVLNKIHAINQMEIQMGEMAKGQAKNKKVKKFGARMVKDHEKADKEVMATAKSDNLAVGEAAHDPSDMTEMEKLKGLSGIAFESAFLKNMQEGHSKAVAFLTEAEAKLTDSKTKKLVEKLLPTIKDHEKEALKLEKKL